VETQGLAFRITGRGSISSHEHEGRALPRKAKSVIIPSMPHSVAELSEIVERFGSGQRIMLLGDVMVDEYIYGDADRLSPEAPVPVVQERYREQRAGGAGNVAAGLAALGATVLCVSACGKDFQGRLLIELFHKMKNAHGSAGGGEVLTDGILHCEDRPTTAKIRLVGLAQHRHPQQMLRLDQETTTALSADQEAWLLAYMNRELPNCAALAIEDYNKGLLSEKLCAAAIKLARELKKPVLIDPAFISDYKKYRGASTITPNRYEAEKGSGIKLDDTIAGAPKLAEALLKNLDLETCLLTLDRHGMYLLEKGKPGEPIPTRPRNVYDVTGAGDMVLATMTMAIAAGGDWSQAAALANMAGGLEVEKFGIVPIKKEELLAEILRQEGDTRGKERTLPALLEDLTRHRRASQKIVFTNGVFDILHAGHVQYLNFSKKQGDVLIVGVNTDESVKRLKGPTRPVNDLADRMAVLSGLAAVDYVISFDTDTPAELIASVRPDILIKGEDYSGKEVVGRETVESHGGKVILAPFLKGKSTTSTIGKMKG
jgi:D-beta-D-heptose 7-phosphate kinase/D-beta-D-heptose 1-phosphate adenosyltransferase